MLVQVVAVEYLRYLKYDCNFKDMAKRHERVGRLTMFWLHREIESLNRDDITNLKEDMLKRKCQPSYINTYLFIVRSLLRFASEQLNLTVMDPGKIKPLKDRKKPVEYLSKETIKKLFSLIKCDGKIGVQVMTIIACLLTSGMRISELVSLNKDTINMENRTAIIVGKGSKVRTVVFKPWAIAWVKLHLSLRNDDCPALFVSYRTNVFRSGVERLRQDGVRYHLRKYSKLVGTKIAPHILRKSAATNLQFEGMSVDFIREFLGHDNIATTQKYLGFNFEIFMAEYDKKMDYGFQPDPKILMKPWSYKWDSCIECNTKEREHAAKGYCYRCYMVKMRETGKKVQTHQHVA